MYDLNYLCERYKLKFTTCEVSISDMKLNYSKEDYLCTSEKYCYNSFLGFTG